MKKQRLEVVVGAQFGSEAKGHVVQRLTERAQRKTVPTVVRVAGPNAGHTGYDTTGRAWALRQVPVAAVTEGPATLVIAPGSEVDLEVLIGEMSALLDAGLMKNKTLAVHPEVTMINDHDKMLESDPITDHDTGTLVQRIGSTGKGIGAARAGRLMREPGRRLLDNSDMIQRIEALGGVVSRFTTQGEHMIIEGTQGYGLGLHAGFYPQCTSSNCRAQDFIAMAGVAPWEYESTAVWAVARMYPIRVAGNSGPLRGETTWEELGLPEERTTVTKKVRRVGMPDWNLVKDAVDANGGAPTVRLAVTMVDQKFPFMKDKPYLEAAHTLGWGNFSKMSEYLRMIERQAGAPIGMITTGPDCASFMNLEQDVID